MGLIPFESERQYSAVLYRDNDVMKVALKGAMEVVLPKCQSMASLGVDQPLHKEGIEKKALELAADGYRVLVLAEGVFNNHSPGNIFEKLGFPPLTVLGLIGSIDPLRQEAKEAVTRCRGAGVQVSMVTGDHPATALSIAREFGIASDEGEVTTGSQLSLVGSETVFQGLDRIRTAKVFARVTPLQKYQIVDTLVGQGHFVAVTGDGVNDAPVTFVDWGSLLLLASMILVTMELFKVVRRMTGNR